MPARGPGLLCRSAILLGLVAVVAGPSQAQQSSTDPLTKPQLEQLVAPIALHPDALLSQMLMASTYPTEVVQAARWMRENPSISGVVLQDAVQKQAWDPSVKALTAVPQTLQMMNDKLDWTQRLGDAFLAQQEDLLAAVQRLRQRAEASGHLKTTDRQSVSKVAAPTASGKAPVITIEPASPEYMYVPVYDPRVCYGEWPYPAHEPFYWYPAGFTGGGVLSFAAGVAVGAAIWGHVDWWRGRVDINVDRYNRFNRTNIVDNAWRHDTRHRGNVPYRDAKVAQRFGDAKRTAAREAYRGKAVAGSRDLAKAKATRPSRDAAAKSAVKQQPAAHAKQSAKGKSAAKTKSASHAKQSARPTAARSTGHAARPKQAARPKAATHGPQVSRMAVRGAQGRAFRPAGGGHRAGMRSGRHRGGGGGRGGRR